jgi:hypothetical protein
MRKAVVIPLPPLQLNSMINEHLPLVFLLIASPLCSTSIMHTHNGSREKEGEREGEIEREIERKQREKDSERGSFQPGAFHFSTH